MDCVGVLGATIDCDQQPMRLLTWPDLVDTIYGKQLGLVVVPVCRDHERASWVAALDSFDVHGIDRLDSIRRAHPPGEVWLMRRRPSDSAGAAGTITL